MKGRQIRGGTPHSKFVCCFFFKLGVPLVVTGGKTLRERLQEAMEEIASPVLSSLSINFLKLFLSLCTFSFEGKGCPRFSRRRVPNHSQDASQLPQFMDSCPVSLRCSLTSWRSLGSLSSGILEPSLPSLAVGSPFPSVGMFPGLLTVTLGKSLAISQPYFPHWQNRNGNSHLLKLLCGLNKTCQQNANHDSWPIVCKRSVGWWLFKPVGSCCPSSSGAGSVSLPELRNKFVGFRNGLVLSVT